MEHLKGPPTVSQVIDWQGVLFVKMTSFELLVY